MELSELRLPEPTEIVPGVCKSVLAPGQDKIERIEYRNDVVVFRVNGVGVAILWVPMPGTVMVRDVNAAF
jgi:hypothetical protein